jgi:hypothetical protein
MWPTILCTIGSGTPRSAMSEMKLCRRSWNLIPPRSAALRSLRHAVRHELWCLVGSKPRPPLSGSLLLVCRERSAGQKKMAGLAGTERLGAHIESAHSFRCSLIQLYKTDTSIGFGVTNGESASFEIEVAELNPFDLASAHTRVGCQYFGIIGDFPHRILSRGRLKFTVLKIDKDEIIN